MSFASQIEDRPQLAEDLWLLRTLRFTKPASKWPELGRDAYQRLVLSDAVALYLTTDEPDGLVAAFYMPENNILYLAKSGSSDPRYVAESNLFFDTLTSADGSEDLFPFLARRSCNRINKRIRKLHKSLKFCHVDLFNRLREYEPTETEFHGPWYRIFIKILQAEYQLDTPSSKEVLIHAITFCEDRLKKNPEFSDKTESHRPFFELLCAASTLLNSQFYERFERVLHTRLERRLEKFVDYLAVSRLIKVWRRYGRDTRIEWITGVEQSRIPRVLTTAGVGERHLNREVDETKSYRPDLFSNMNWRYRGWQGDATKGITFVPCMHAEINLILHLMSNVKNFQSQVDEPLPIGSGERTCFACSLWMDEFNRILKMKWTTSGNNGKPGYNWALPNAEAIVPYVGVEGYNRITSHICQGVTDAIGGVIRDEVVKAIESFHDRCYSESMEKLRLEAAKQS
ncbi:hypothetical protein J132_04527 [Termitomyces sp. J132]|nr:hypothetical protein H2248_005817 [Termitomyces sp. 'cryptogamus']KNZ77708.1 hypothetical protein J132_04527 [Termitomyces sp. J132]